MNSNFGKGSSGSGNFNFDLGFGSNRPVSLKDQKNPTSSSSFSSYSSTNSQPKPAWQPNKPSWTHRPAPNQPTRTGLNGPTSMVGDIHGKSWNSTGSGSGIRIVEKNPNLFGDLVSSALGQGIKGNSNVPLKNAAPTSKNSAYSMGNLADSLPKSSNSASVGGNRGSSGGFGYNQSSGSVNSAFSGNGNANFSSNRSTNIGGNRSSNRSTNIGGPSMKSMAGGGGGGVGLGGNKDPFGSLVDLASKPSSGSLNSAAKNSKSNNGGDYTFGIFQNAAKPSTQSNQTSGFAANTSDFMGSNTGFSSGIDYFGFGSNGVASQKQPPVQTTNEDPLSIFFSPSSGNTAAESAGGLGEQLSGLDDWGMEPDYSGVGGDSGAGTTELEGLPPPPAGFSAAAAKNKGIDNQKQGQYADAIKWLSWAVVLLEKSGDSAGSMEVLSCRASCYKEVGEYKKAVADCTKVLEFDDKNTSALVQRALLYESMEKYKLGAEDLRTVLKIDPANRIARSTIHRLTKMVS